MLDFYSRFLLPLRSLPVPTVAAIHGPAVGAGMALALGCDVRIASAKARLGFTFVGLGLHPGMGCTHFLPQIAGPEVAARLLLTGEKVTGAEARELRLVSEVAADAEACLESSVARAKQISLAGPLAVQTCTATLRGRGDAGLMAALQREASAQALCYATGDFAEGLRAITEKREPAFTGS